MSRQRRLEKQVKGIWDALYSAGKIDRAFDIDRYRAMIQNLRQAGIFDANNMIKPEFNCFLNGTYKTPETKV